MSQFQIQGPQEFLRPKAPVFYQETQTILPQPSVGVGQGIDWGQIAESVSRLGIETVTAINEQKNEKKQIAIDALTDRTKEELSRLSENGQFDEYDKRYSDYKKQVSTILDYDIDRPDQELDNDVPFGGATRQLVARARKHTAAFEGLKEQAQLDYSNLVEADTLETYVLRTIDNIDKLPPDQQIKYIEEMAQPDLGRMFSERFKANIFQLDPNAPRSKRERAYARSIEEAYIRLNSKKDEAKRAVAKAAKDQEEITFDLPKNLAIDANEKLGSVKTKIDKLPVDKNKWTPEHKELFAKTVRGFEEGNRGLGKAINAIFYTAWLQDQQRRELGGETGPTIPFESSEFYIKPEDLFSQETREKITEIPGLPPELLRAYSGALETIDVIRITSTGKAVEHADLQTKIAKDSREGQLKDKAKQTETRIDALIATKKASPELSHAVDLEIQKLVATFEREATDILNRAAPTKNKTLFNFMFSPESQRNPIGSFLEYRTTPIFDLSLMGNLISSEVEDNSPFREEFNNAFTLNMNLHSKAFGVFGVEKITESAKKKRIREQENLQILTAIRGGKPSQYEITQERLVEVANLAISLLMPDGESTLKEDGTQRPLTEVVELLKKSPKTGVGLTLDLLMRTPYWDQLMSEVQNSSTPEQTFQDLLAPFVDGIQSYSFDDLKSTMQAPWTAYDVGANEKKTFSRGVKSTNPNQFKATAALFLMMPEDQRKQLIAHVDSMVSEETNPVLRNQLASNKAFLEYADTNYRRENPFSFVDEVSKKVSPENIEKYSMMKQTSREANGQHISEESKKGIDKAIKDGTASQDSLNKRQLADYQETFRNLYKNLNVRNGSDKTQDGSTVKDSFIAILSDTSNDAAMLSKQRKLRAVVDDILLDAVFDVRAKHPTLTDTEDINSLILARANADLSKFVYKGGQIRFATPEETVQTNEAVALNRNITAMSNISEIAEPEQLILNSNTYDVDMTSEKAHLVTFPQFGSNAETFKKMVSGGLSPHVATVVCCENIPPQVLGLVSGRDTLAFTIQLADAALDGNTDNASIIAAMAALNTLPVSESREQAIGNARASAARIRNDLLNGNLKFNTVSRPSYRNPTQSASTLVLNLGGREVASMQPTSASVPKNMNQSGFYIDLLSKMDIKQVAKIHDDPKIWGTQAERPFTEFTKRDAFITDWMKQQPEDTSIRVGVTRENLGPNGQLYMEATRYSWRVRKGQPEIVKVRQVGQTMSKDSPVVWRDIEDPVLVSKAKPANQNKTQTQQPKTYILGEKLPRMGGYDYTDRSVIHYLDEDKKTGNLGLYKAEVITGGMALPKGMFETRPHPYREVSGSRKLVKENISEQDFKSLFVDGKYTADTEQVKTEALASVEMVPNPKMFNVWKALWRDFPPPLFVEGEEPQPQQPTAVEQEQKEELSQAFVDEINRWAVDDVPKFNLFKSLFRDLPPFFIEEEGGKKLKPNPRMFNLWKALRRDLPPFFVEN